MQELLPAVAQAAGAPVTEWAPARSGGSVWQVTVAGRSAYLRALAPDDPEPAVLASLADLGLPAPRVLARGPGFLLTSAIPGRSLERVLRRRTLDDAAGAALLARCGALLARGHAVEPPWPLTYTDDLDRRLDRWEAQVKEELPAEARPLLLVALAELRHVRPAFAPLRLHHGAVRPEHIIVDGDEPVALVSWRRAGLAPPQHDLAALRPALRLLGRRERDAERLEQSLLGGYLAAGGGPVEALGYWRALISLEGAVAALAPGPGGAAEWRVREAQFWLAELRKACGI